MADTLIDPKSLVKTKNPDNIVKYNKDLDYTYIMDSNGKQLGGMEGDHTHNPNAYDPVMSQQMGMDKPQTNTSGAEKFQQLSKDFVVNAAAQAPLSFIPGVGPGAAIGRAALSGATSYGMDTLLNVHKSGQEKGINAVLNIILGEVAPWLASKGGGLELPGKTSVRTAEPTLLERESTSSRSGSSSGESTGRGTTRGTSEGGTTSTGRGTTKGEFESTSIRQPYTGEITPEMQNLRDSIEGFKTKLEGAKNKSQVTQLQNVIGKYQDALAAHEDMQSGTITKTEGTRSGESTNQQQSQHTNTNQGSSTNQNQSSGSSQSSGTSQSTGTRTPGTVTTTTTGETLAERVVQGILDAHKSTIGQISKLKDFLIGTGAQDVKSAADDLGKK